MPPRKKAKPAPGLQRSESQTPQAEAQQALPASSGGADGAENGSTPNEQQPGQAKPARNESKETKIPFDKSSFLGPAHEDGEKDITTPNPTRGWYGGAWPLNPKAAAVAEVAGGGLLNTGGTIAKVVAGRKSSKGRAIQKRSDSINHLSPGGSSRSLPTSATTTKVNISSGSSSQHLVNGAQGTSNDSLDRPAKSLLIPSGDDQKKSLKVATARSSQPSQTETPVQNQSLWTKWFFKGEIQGHHTEHQTPVDGKPRNGNGKTMPKTPLSSTSKADQPKAIDQDEPKAVSKFNGKSNERASLPRNWLGLFGGISTPAENRDSTHGEVRGSSNEEPRIEASSLDGGGKGAILPAKFGGDRKSESLNTGWAFWSKSSSETGKDVGQLAVAGSSSQSHPQTAVMEGKGLPKVTSTSLGKRTRPISLDSRGEQKDKDHPKAETRNSEGSESGAGTASNGLSGLDTTSQGENSGHLLLPLFKETYSLTPENPSLIQQIGRLIYGGSPPARHPNLLRDPPQIKKALAIGVHGYFPMPIIQTVIGRPTGTSIKFAESAAIAIRRYVENRGNAVPSIEKIALEGEGKVEERLDVLWKLLLNWIDKIRQADFILVACHSQGVPVAVSLMAKLIGFGCVNGARIGICAMAGINLGPFLEYKSRWIGGSAGELFDFARPDSQVSKGYETSLGTILSFGAKIVFVGSLDDQLVSLHSSTFGVAQHPNIYRAVWIDGRVHAPDFLSHLVGFALKLRNLGVSDHGLIRELSNPLAGSLVGGEGHSRIYEDQAVYKLAVEFTAETSSLSSASLLVDRYTPSISQNPYILPFAMRGVLEEDFVRKELSAETHELLKQFDNWKPSTKALRDVKYRLEGVRSKL